jgi:type II secretory pathway pseudopilin PulG
MNKAFTLPELFISLLILSLSLVFLVTFSNSYLSILNDIRKRYLGLNVAQAGLEYSLALRNKQIENNQTPWSGVSLSGSYCLSFNTTTKNINIFPSTQPCPSEIPGYSRLLFYKDFENPNNNNLNNARAIKIISESYFGKDKIRLDIVLTKWHPIQR